MQRFYDLICQSTWCQNASKLIYQKGEISFLWDTKNVVYCKFDFHAWRWTGRWQKSSGLENRPTPGMVFPKHPVFHFAPMFHFALTYYTHSLWDVAQVLNIVCERWYLWLPLYIFSIPIHHFCLLFYTTLCSCDSFSTSFLDRVILHRSWYV